MKRGWKIFWIVCAACLAVGLVCCAASFAMGVTAEAIAGRFPNGIGFVMDHDRYSDDNYIGDVPMDDAIMTIMTVIAMTAAIIAAAPIIRMFTMIWRMDIMRRRSREM